MKIFSPQFRKLQLTKTFSLACNIVLITSTFQILKLTGAPLVFAFQQNHDFLNIVAACKDEMMLK
jgi:hypothetical protein